MPHPLGSRELADASDDVVGGPAAGLSTMIRPLAVVCGTVIGGSHVAARQAGASGRRQQYPRRRKRRNRRLGRGRPRPAQCKRHPHRPMTLIVTETCQMPSSASFSTTATSASSVLRTMSITGSAASSGSPARSRSARVTVVQTRPRPLAAAAVQGGAAKRGREHAEVAERRAVVQLARDGARIDPGREQPGSELVHLRRGGRVLERPGVRNQPRVQARARCPGSAGCPAA